MVWQRDKRPRASLFDVKQEKLELVGTFSADDNKLEGINKEEILVDVVVNEGFVYLVL